MTFECLFLRSTVKLLAHYVIPTLWRYTIYVMEIVDINIIDHI